jgi:DNA topoisomerase IA
MQVAKDKERLGDQLRNEARAVQWLVLWLDCDREGENIAYEVINVCRAANPRCALAVSVCAPQRGLQSRPTDLT